MIRFEDPITGYAIVIQQYQWGFREGTEYLVREWGETGAGVVWRERIPYRNRKRLTVTFKGDRAMLEKIRTLAYLVMDHGGVVQFYPSTQSTQYWWVNWPQMVENLLIADWRHEITLDLPENMEGPDVPVVPVYESQITLEVFLSVGKYAHEAHVTLETIYYPPGPYPAREAHVAVETMLYPPIPTTAYLVHEAQMAVEAMAYPPVPNAMYAAYATQIAVEAMVSV